MNVHSIAPDLRVLADYLEVPGIGALPVNAFVLLATEPVVVDTGLGLPDRDFLDALATVMDPPDVQWIWLTHPDRDHTGALFDLLDAAPSARVITTFLGVGIMSTERPLPIDRVYLLNPGQSIDVGDRQLLGFRPPLFDNPATLGFFDDTTGACFTSDCFGAPMPTADAATGTGLDGIAADDLRARQLLWAAVDSPWVRIVDRSPYLETVTQLRTMQPSTILSTHLPPAATHHEEFLAMLAAAPDADPFVGPDQAALEAMLNGS